MPQTEAPGHLQAELLSRGVRMTRQRRTILGLVDELDLMHVRGEGHYYERRHARDHMHMTCLRCGKVVEFESDLFEQLKGQVQSDCNFHIMIARLEIGGYCPDCRR
jgi:Fur family ferric uptake transcriptional regulator